MGRLVFMAVILFSVASPAVRCWAGVVLDGTLGKAGPLSGPNYQITPDLGKTLGPNLFHSFRNFNLSSQEIATFSGPANIENVISRVTGGEPSSIDGLIRSTIPGASLYFLNPAGLMFGPDARLDIDGSFHVSTADYLRLGSDGRFDALSPEASVLTVAPPSAFGFVSGQPAPIGFSGSIMSVPTGSALSVVGGDLTIHNAYLLAFCGAVDLVSAAGAGEVALPSADISSLSSLGTITITHDPGVPRMESSGFGFGNIDTGGTPGGSVSIRGGRLVIDGGWVLADGFKGNAGPVAISAGSLEMVNGSLITSSTYDWGTGGRMGISVRDSAVLSGGSRIESVAQGEGDSGAIGLHAGSLVLSGKSRIQTMTTGPGSAGAVGIAVTGQAAISGESGIRSDAQGDGNAGSVALEAAGLDLSDGSWVETATEGAGSGGRVHISVSGDLVLTRDSGIMSGSLASGDGGDIVLSAGSLSAADKSTILTSSKGAGRAGTIGISVKNGMVLRGESFVTSRNLSDGDSGSIALSAGWLEASGGSIIDTGTNGRGSAGRIAVQIDEAAVLAEGSRVASSARGDGNAGSVELSAGSLLMSDASKIQTSTDNNGAAGTIGIRVREAALLSNGSMIQSDASGDGKGGSVSLSSGRLELSDDSWIEASTRGAGSGGKVDIAVTGAVVVARNGGIDSSSLGTGEGGNVVVNSGSLALSGDAVIQTISTATGTAGTIRITVKDNVLLSQGGIVSSARGDGNAGTIGLSAGQLLMSDGAAISSHAQGAGAAGTIDVGLRDTALLVGGSVIMSNSSGDGDAGSVSLSAESIAITDASVETSAEGRGSAGRLRISAREEIALAGGSMVLSVAAGDGMGGSVSVDARDLTVGGDAVVATSSLGMGTAGAIDIALSGGLSLWGSGRILSDARGDGNGGSVTVTTGRIDMRENAVIEANTLGKGTGGDVSITAGETVQMSGDSRILNNAYGDGNAGSIALSSGSLSLAGVSAIDSSTQGAGSAGAVDIGVRDVCELAGESYIATAALGNGRGGVISLAAGSLALRDKAIIQTSTKGLGSSGSINLNVDGAVVLSGDSGVVSNAFGEGNAGSISLAAGSLALKETSEIQTSSTGEGDAGSISAAIRGNATVDHAKISSEAVGSGDGGDISLSAGDVRILDGGMISASSGGAGHAGQIVVNAAGQVFITGYTFEGNYVIPSGIYSIAAGDGRGGDISVTTGKLYLGDEGTVNARTVGQGDAGDVKIRVGDVFALVKGSVTTEAEQAGGGTISIGAGMIILADRSHVTASAKAGEGGGGNVTINAPLLTAIQNSDITARADQGFGGNIAINAEAVLHSPDSDFNASSNVVGREGTIRVNAPVIDISGRLVGMPAGFLNAEALMPKTCEGRYEQDSSFVVSGRGGIPPVPGDDTPRF